MNTSRLILVLTYSCADSAFIHGNPQETVIVDSPESAAITLFKHQKMRLCMNAGVAFYIKLTLKK